MALLRTGIVNTSAVNTLPIKPAKGVYLRNGGYWFAQQKEGKRSWTNLQTRDPFLAIQRAAELRHTPMRATGEPVSAVIGRFLLWKLDRDEYTRNSADKARVVLGDFAKHIRQMTLREVTPQTVQEWYESTRRRVTESTAQSYAMVVRSLFKWAVEVERARLDNPVTKLRMARLPKTARVTFSTKETRDRLIAEAPTDDLRFILFCGFHAGFRRNEISEARVNWFDLGSELIHIQRTATFRAKDREDRTIPMTQPFLAFLRRYLDGKAPDGFALKPDVAHGRFRYRYDFRRPFNDYMRTQGVEVTAHSMRRTFAALLASAGVSIYKIAKWLGDDVRVTQRHYAHLSKADDDIRLLE